MLCEYIDILIYEYMNICIYEYMCNGLSMKYVCNIILANTLKCHQTWLGHPQTEWRFIAGNQGWLPYFLCVTCRIYTYTYDIYIYDYICSVCVCMCTVYIYMYTCTYVYSWSMYRMFLSLRVCDLVSSSICMLDYASNHIVLIYRYKWFIRKPSFFANKTFQLLGGFYELG
jgi:hypothetical protein